jgi:hypothetical protein
MEIEPEEYRVWMKETYGSMAYLHARDWNDYYTDEEHGMMREVLTKEHIAQALPRKRSRGSLLKMENEITWRRGLLRS